jgi:outer membrane protein assembly factor BamA
MNTFAHLALLPERGYGVGPMRTIAATVLLAAGFLLFALPRAHAAPPPSLPAPPAQVAAPADSTDGPVIGAVQFEGLTHFSETDLRRRIRTAPNRRILGIPGVAWWRWIYQLGDADWMWQPIGSALKASGEPPAYVDSTTLASDVERLQLFYQQQGFRQARIEAEVQSTLSPDRVTVVFRVASGPPTVLRRIRYEGVETLTPPQQRRLSQETVLRVDPTTPDQPLERTARNQRYEKPLLLQERRRLLTFLRNEGYARVSRDSIRAVIYEPAPDTFDVTFRIQTGARYRFGDVDFTVTGPGSEVAPRTDTLAVQADSAGGATPIVRARIEQDGRLGTALLRRSLQFRPGAFYNRSQVLATKRKLESAGVFAFTNIVPQFEDTQKIQSPATGATVRYVPIRIEARTRSRHQVRAETFALQREVVSDVENELGLGVGLTYENVNALGGGEALQVSTSASVATGLDSTLVTSAQFEASTSLTLPYLVQPFDRLNRLFDLEDARTRIALSFLSARRNDLSLRIRGRGSAQFRLVMDHTPTLQSLVDVYDVSLSNPDTLRGFQRRFLDRVLGVPGGEGSIQDPVQRTQILEDYTQPQINTALRYTLRSATAAPLQRTSGHVYEASAEVGNTLPWTLDRLVFTPDSLEFSLPGLSGDPARPDTTRGAVILGDRLIYRPYVRFTTDLRRYTPLSGATTLATKFFAGIAHPIARPTIVPFDRRFFSGGASSVRGWRLRELGPGSANLNMTDSTGGDIANILGGDVKLEASVELRTTLFRNVLAARWIGAAFLDAGNVWFGPRNPGLTTPDGEARAADRNGKFRVPDFLGDVGVSSGGGLRIAWEYLIVRLDLAYPLRDPSPTNDDIFADTFSGPLLHFGIGHAF